MKVGRKHEFVLEGNGSKISEYGCGTVFHGLLPVCKPYLANSTLIYLPLTTDIHQNSCCGHFHGLICVKSIGQTGIMVINVLFLT